MEVPRGSEGILFRGTHGHLYKDLLQNSILIFKSYEKSHHILTDLHVCACVN